jgi:hypothetical protein
MANPSQLGDWTARGTAAASPSISPKVKSYHQHALIACKTDMGNEAELGVPVGSLVRESQQQGIAKQETEIDERHRRRSG